MSRSDAAGLFCSSRTRARLVEIGDRIRHELGRLAVDRIAAGEVFGAVRVAELVEVPDPSQLPFESGPTLGDLARVGDAGAGEAQ